MKEKKKKTGLVGSAFERYFWSKFTRIRSGFVDYTYHTDAFESEDGRAKEQR